MPHKELSEQFLHVIDTMHRVMGIKHTCHDEFPVTPLQLLALEYLYKHPASTVGDLGSYLHISSSAVAQLTTRLANLRFIKRQHHAKDRRVVLLTLTPKGKKVYESFYAFKMKHMNTLLSYMPEKDIKSLIRIFNTVLTAIEYREQNT